MLHPVSLNDNILLMLYNKHNQEINTDTADLPQISLVLRALVCVCVFVLSRTVLSKLPFSISVILSFQECYTYVILQHVTFDIGFFP